MAALNVEMYMRRPDSGDSRGIMYGFDCLELIEAIGTGGYRAETLEFGSSGAGFVSSGCA